MSASILVLDLLRSHYRRDEQAFRTFALRLARMTKSDNVRTTMIDVIERPGPGARSPQPGPGRFQPLAPPKPTSSELLEPLGEVTLDDLLLEDDLRSQIDEIVLEIAHAADLNARGLRPRCRLLFEGPPGNGKTSSGAAIAHELGIPAFGVSIPSLVSKWIGESAQNVGALFAQLNNGALVVFDELDAIGGARMKVDQSASAEHNKTVNALLTMLDRKLGGLLVATTNRADVLDPALLRRFDEIVTFPAPSQAQMSQLAGRLEDRFAIPRVDLTGCENFDAVTKRVLRDARRLIMREILAAKAAESEELPEEGLDEDRGNDAAP